MTLSETIEAAGAIVGCYPNGGKDAGRSYIGALAATLSNYPKSVAQACADRVKGVARDCRFLPTVADLVAWCEKKTEPLRVQADRDRRVARQLDEREQFENIERNVRPTRLSVAELKERYGDWGDNWRTPGTKEIE